MNTGQAQAMRNMTASHRPQAHTHQLRPERSMSTSVATSSGPPSNTASARLLPRSARNRPGVVRLKPKRVSSRKVRHTEKGRLASCTSSATLAITSTPSHGCVKRSEEHTSELQSQSNLVCRLLLEKTK